VYVINFPSNLLNTQEIDKTNNDNQEEDTGRYRQLLVRTLHSATIKFPAGVAIAQQQIFPALMELLASSDNTGDDDTAVAVAMDVLVFAREAIQRLPQLRPVIVGQLLVRFFFALKNLSFFVNAFLGVFFHYFISFFLNFFVIS